jgi:hypothetical protein
MITFCTPQFIYRATPQPDHTFVGIDKVWNMELDWADSDSESWEQFDCYFTEDVFDLIREKLAPSA